jgi:hypothetical protein
VSMSLEPGSQPLPAGRSLVVQDFRLRERFGGSP